MEEIIGGLTKSEFKVLSENVILELALEELFNNHQTETKEPLKSVGSVEHKEFIISLATLIRTGAELYGVYECGKLLGKVSHRIIRK